MLRVDIIVREQEEFILYFTNEKIHSQSYSFVFSDFIDIRNSFYTFIRTEGKL